MRKTLLTILFILQMPSFVSGQNSLSEEVRKKSLGLIPKRHEHHVVNGNLINYGFKDSVFLELKDSEWVYTVLSTRTPMFQIESGNTKRDTKKEFRSKLDEKLLDNSVIEKLKQHYNFDYMLNHPRFALPNGSGFVYEIFFKYNNMLNMLHGGNIPWIVILQGQLFHSDVGLGLLLKNRKNEYRLLNKDDFVELFTPISSCCKAIEYLCLLENVHEIYDFSFLYNPKRIYIMNKKADRHYEVFQPIIYYTKARKYNAGFEVNLFSYEDDICYEILYRVTIQGGISIVEKKPLFRIPQDIGFGDSQ